MKDEKLLDESIHLINACQLAGFRHVVGTLWEVNNESCVDMARLTYEAMKDGGMTDSSVCLGLHRATRKLQDHWRNSSTTLERRNTSNTIVDVPGDGKSQLVELTKRGRHGYRIPKKAVLVDSDDEDEGGLQWVPYVHSVCNQNFFFPCL
ncbi:hypothetical protein GQ44DRAFT_353570 [Phaeosphaeriaceae sp. PMI808]|nr:hypothetical protein GQ44DRAFT_353570 [Phaeosphaeriaceae sp. PMI808]